MLEMRQVFLRSSSHGPRVPGRLGSDTGGTSFWIKAINGSIGFLPLCRSWSRWKEGARVTCPTFLPPSCGLLG